MLGVAVGVVELPAHAAAELKSRTRQLRLNIGISAPGWIE
jgi:hypothetical protein